MRNRIIRARHVRPAVAFALSAVVTLGVLAAPTAATPSAAEDASRKVQADLLGAFDDQAREQFVIEFGEFPDLAAASRIRDWTERGEAVADALRKTAETSQADVIADLEAQGADYQSFWINNTIHVESGTRRMALTAAGDDSVVTVRAADSIKLEQPVKAGPATNAASGVEWGIADIKADQVWENYDARGQGIVVASIDSGVQYDHPALAATYRGNLGDGNIAHDYNWWDPAKICGFQETKPCDNAGHGTHTMGTMVGDGGEGNKIGVAPEARWIAAKGCEFDSCSEFALTSSAQWVLEPTDRKGQNPDASKRPQIVNNSWGGGGGDTWYQDFVRAWVAAGMFPVFSNGNAGPACATSGSPGDYPESYSVGNYTIDGTIAPSSSRGPGMDGENKPNISAPGTDVRSSVPGDGYAAFTGTSMAAPHLAGTIALVWSAAPSLIGDIDATRQLLDDTARDTADAQCGGSTDDNNVYGEGRLDALAVVEAAPKGAVGTLQGTVTDRDSGEPVTGARIILTGASSRSATTAPGGNYSIALTPGTYALDVAAFGFRTKHVDGVVVRAGEATTADVAVEVAERVVLSGSVRDDSGQGWPLYARVDLAGTPLSTFTNPVTGRYSIEVPDDATYEIRVAAEYPGYRSLTEAITLDGDASHDWRLDVDSATCTAPGYRRGDGLRENFETGAMPDGWSVVDADTGQTWAFDDPGVRGNLTGGLDGFAGVDADLSGRAAQDTSLVSPAADLTGMSDPVLEFATDLKHHFYEQADVDVSVDGGTTWSNVWHAKQEIRGPEKVRVDLSTAANESDVRVRFRYHGPEFTEGWWWQVDDLFLGENRCVEADGGLLVGHTASPVIGAGVAGAEVVSDDVPRDRTTSVATPADDGLEDGVYWLFSSRTGKHRFTASADDYQPATVGATVRENQATRLNIDLRTGRLEPAVRIVEDTVKLGRRKTVPLRLVNIGDGKVRYQLEERGPESSQPSASSSGAISELSSARPAPVMRVPARVSPGPEVFEDRAAVDAGPTTTALSGDPWQDAANYPIPIADSTAGYLDGRIYSFGGLSGFRKLQSAYRYDPAAGHWQPLADMPQARQKPVGGFVDGTFVVTGGWGIDNEPVAATSIYDPATDTWTSAAPNPRPWGASGSAVLDGMLYVVGGCPGSCVGEDDVLRYDPQADTWEQVADYPQGIAHPSCGAVLGKLYCAGGLGEDSTSSPATYAYTPAADSWERVADLPADLWGSAHIVANGQLVVAGGVVNRGSQITNEGYAYDPMDDTWSRLPNATNALYRSAGACGFYKIGGSDGERQLSVPVVEHLPGLTDCAPPRDSAWLKTRSAAGTVRPHEGETVELTLDATEVTKPGTYSASLRIYDDSPLTAPTVRVRMVVTPRR
ncbi:MAG TPA: S8 family serine peptidase [Nocardioidaceae bacterium]|nr:S8 family serine peptidase [Nocardioidaceae bacterium]